VRCDRQFEENCNRALDLVADAADNDSQLMVLPELCTLVPDQIGQDVALAEERSRKFEEALAAHCRDLAISVATSLITQADGAYFHTGVLLDDRGQRRIAAHQTHLPQSYRTWCSPGDRLDVFETSLGRVAIMVGYDAVFPEVASVLARRGAEVILHPTAWKFDWEVRLALPERAAENRVSILSAARSDTQVSRGGLISALSESKPLRARDLNPIWPVEAPFDRETYVSAKIVPARSRNKDLLGFDLQRGRRPELYRAILQS
jgi:predicted amidohydrolase